MGLAEKDQRSMIVFKVCDVANVRFLASVLGLGCSHLGSQFGEVMT